MQNRYTLTLRNGVMLDARPDGPSREAFEAAWQRDCASDCDRDGAHAGDAARVAPPPTPHGVLAIGHKINHPPRGVAPNVRVVPFDVERHQHVPLHAHLRAFNAQPPTAGTPWKRTAVLIATRALCDEELWLDYKLSADAATLPSWYTPCERAPAEMK